jgi:hypothetical protein
MKPPKRKEVEKRLAKVEQEKEEVKTKSKQDGKGTTEDQALGEDKSKKVVKKEKPTNDKEMPPQAKGDESEKKDKA